MSFDNSYGGGVDDLDEDSKMVRINSKAKSNRNTSQSWASLNKSTWIRLNRDRKME